MQRFRDMSINRKLTVLVLTSCAAVLILAGIAMIATEVATSRRYMIDDLGIKADLLGRNSAAPLSFHRDPDDREELTKTLSALAVDPHIVGACVYDADGDIFGRYIRKGETSVTFPSTPPPVGRKFGSDYLEITHPVFEKGNRVGTIFIRTDLGRLYGQIEMHGAIILAILVAAIVLTIGVMPRLRQPITEPVLALADVARRIAKYGDYSTRAKKYGDDEVGLLTDAFNRMLDEIENTHSSLRVAKETAEAANRAKDQFLAVLSHELRTPLTPVLLAVSLLEENNQLQEDVHEDLQSIRRHVELEARLIDDMLDLTRISRGKLQLNFQPADVHKIIVDAANICCSDRMDDIKFSLDADEHFVRADSGRLTQVFWNLLSNAKKFTPAGSEIRVQSSNAPDGKIRVKVTDTGAGIEPSMLPRIFNAFEQAGANRLRQVGGLGLGLTIAKALVDAHGGTISAHSEGPGTGATFIVELNTIGTPAKQPTALAPAPGEGITKPLQLNLLLVEDHVSTLKIMTRLLKRSGYQVTGAGSVKDALDAAANKKFDLVVSDLGLPDGSGYDLMKQLHNKYGMRGISVSGFGMEQDIARSAEAGFTQHLTKPIGLSKLRTAISTVMAAPNPPPDRSHPNDFSAAGDVGKMI